jgi:hypothetical protein
LGTDQDGSDGWSQVFDASALPEQKDIAFFANVYDWAGNWTGAGAWNIGIDWTPPSTALAGLAATQQSTAVLLKWSGNDNVAGIEIYNLQSQIGVGAWSDLLPNPDGATTQTWFIASPATNYGFRLRGLDYAGNLEAFPTSAETITAIPSPAVICSDPDTWDSGGNDNSPGSARPINPDSDPETHNFCNPLAANRLNDEDWVRINVIKGQSYIFRAVPTAGMAAAILELYAANGSTLIASGSANEFGTPTTIQWTSNRNGQIYLRVRHIDGKVAGNVVTYALGIAKVSKMYLPIVNQ